MLKVHSAENMLKIIAFDYEIPGFDLGKANSFGSISKNSSLQPQHFMSNE
jgi:hypothetical protein